MTRGGFRKHAGRKPEFDTKRAIDVHVKLADPEHAELLGAAGDQALATYLRESGLMRARRIRW